MTLKINNKTYPIIIAKDFKTRLIGLMGKQNIDYGMLFPHCNGVHTFFMKEEIDIIGLNEENQIIYIYRNVPKNKIIKIKESNQKTSILELPKNTSQKLYIGSIIKFDKNE